MSGVGGEADVIGRKADITFFKRRVDTTLRNLAESAATCVRWCPPLLGQLRLGSDEYSSSYAAYRRLCAHLAVSQIGHAP